MPETVQRLKDELDADRPDPGRRLASSARAR